MKYAVVFQHIAALSWYNPDLGCGGLLAYCLQAMEKTQGHHTFARKNNCNFIWANTTKLCECSFLMYVGSVIKNFHHFLNATYHDTQILSIKYMHWIVFS